MNDAHFHLIVNHLPIIIPIIGVILMISGFIFKAEILKRAGYLFFILAAITAFFAMSSGEEAEEIVEELQGIEHRFIEAHEENAETFATLLYILGGFALVGIWANLKNKSYSKIIAFITMAFTLVVLFYAQKTGTTGGEIRHSEIRTEASLESK
ncbi:hypothetical protein [Marivirga harenae]|uniref:hypothetical protein n=1 Tax=Marivirga harenae TaxID=2010992 RepID=UPI0026E0DE18|nr:hypothetical protein [Marivirga harenae]WKV11917.1 hypothetical protein Q3Y49_17080 [Marivirga harenae]